MNVNALSIKVGLSEIELNTVTHQGQIEKVRLGLGGFGWGRGCEVSKTRRVEGIGMGRAT